MTLAPARGTALRQHVVRIRFERGARRGPKLPDLSVAEVRRLLRTDMTVKAIADHFGIGVSRLERFVRRRNICDLTARRQFITLQESLKK